jgi:hypothetical protein
MADCTLFLVKIFRKPSNLRKSCKGSSNITLKVILLMTQVVDFCSTFLTNTILNTIFYFCGRGVRGCEESIYSIWQASCLSHMSHPISCTDSELAADNLTKIHLDSPNLTNWSTKPQYGQSLPWPIGAQNPYGQSLTWPKALNPYGQSYSLTWTWGVNPHGQSLD